MSCTGRARERSYEVKQMGTNHIMYHVHQKLAKQKRTHVLVGGSGGSTYDRESKKMAI